MHPGAELNHQPAGRPAQLESYKKKKGQLLYLFVDHVATLLTSAGQGPPTHTKTHTHSWTHVHTLSAHEGGSAFFLRGV